MTRHREDGVRAFRLIAPGEEPIRWVRHGRIEVWANRRLVRLEGRTVQLTPGEMTVLLALLCARGEPVSRGALAALCSRRPSKSKRGGRTPDVHVLAIRRKLAVEPAIIVTVKLVGYAVDC